MHVHALAFADPAGATAAARTLSHGTGAERAPLQKWFSGHAVHERLSLKKRSLHVHAARDDACGGEDELPGQGSGAVLFCKQ